MPFINRIKHIFTEQFLESYTYKSALDSTFSWISFSSSGAKPNCSLRGWSSSTGSSEVSFRGKNVYKRKKLSKKWVTLPNESNLFERLVDPIAQANLLWLSTGRTITFAASVSERVRRESWHESKQKKEMTGVGEGREGNACLLPSPSPSPSPSPFHFFFVCSRSNFSRNNSIGNACYAG